MTLDSTTLDSTTLSDLVLTVTDPGGDPGTAGTLPNLVAYVNSYPGYAYTINFDGAVFGQLQTISLGSPLELTAGANVTIDGPDPGLVVDCGGSGTAFTIDSGATVDISGVSVINATASGIRNAGTLTVTSCTFSGNVGGLSGLGTGWAGGGIANTGTLTVTSCTFSDNSAWLDAGGYVEGCGGGISNGGTLKVYSSTFSGNSAEYGGGIYNSSAATVSGSTFSANSALPEPYYDGVTYSPDSYPGYGGGIYNGYCSTLTIDSSAFIEQFVAVWRGHR